MNVNKQYTSLPVFKPGSRVKGHSQSGRGTYLLTCSPSKWVTVIKKRRTVLGVRGKKHIFIARKNAYAYRG